MLAFKTNLLLYSLINCANIAWILFFPSQHSFTYVWISPVLSFKTIVIISFWCKALSRRVMINLAFHLRLVVIIELVRILVSILARSEATCLKWSHLWYSTNRLKLCKLLACSHSLYISMRHISIILREWSILSLKKLRVRTGR